MMVCDVMGYVISEQVIIYSGWLNLVEMKDFDRVEKRAEPGRHGLR